ncbi:MAG: hypothetical protein GX683_00220 [Ruminococcaceae bacterium]|nr:hypothetical protein [Oscillospiraceae bacterium]
MDYKNALREAHIASLKGKYEEIMREANEARKEKEQEYMNDAQAAYLEKEKTRKERPQQLRASGISGGASEEEMENIELEYGAELSRLDKERQSYADEYKRVLDKQTRLMNTALREYNARIALEDSAAAKTTSKSRAGGSQTSGSRRYSATGGIGPDMVQDILENSGIRNVQLTLGSKKVAPDGDDILTEYIPRHKYPVD